LKEILKDFIGKVQHILKKWNWKEKMWFFEMSIDQAAMFKIVNMQTCNPRYVVRDLNFFTTIMIKLKYLSSNFFILAH
jgi:hypothetical protein